MQRTNQPTPPGPYPPLAPTPSPPLSRQNKVLSQREYRERELESFNTLRDIIRILTGEELRTRQEILKKTIDLLLSLSGIGRQGDALVGPSIPHGALPSTMVLGASASAQSAPPSMAHSAQTSQWPQTWHSEPGFGAATPDYGTHFHIDQQYQFPPTMGSTFNQFSSPGLGEESSDYHQFGRPF